MGYFARCTHSFRGHADSYRCTFYSCGGVRGRTKPMSMSTRCQDRCPAAEKLAYLQQAQGRLHVETWARRDGNPSLQISQVVDIMLESADMVTRLLVIDGENSQVWGMVVPGCLGREQCFFCTCCVCELGSEGIVPHSLGGTPTFFVFLLVCVFARYGCRATIWRGGVGHC